MSLLEWLASAYIVGWLVSAEVVILRSARDHPDTPFRVKLVAGLVCGLMWPVWPVAVVLAVVVDGFLYVVRKARA